MHPITVGRNATIEVECFPLVNIILAANLTKLDVLILDVQGAEVGILKTINWKKVDIKVSKKRSKTCLISIHNK
jgi:FkbM family methyltransferase